MRLALIWLFFATGTWGQNPTAGVVQRTSGPCSVAVNGNNNQVFTCQDFNDKQAQQILAILNRIAAKQLDPALVMEKLDEILSKIRSPRRLSSTQKADLSKCLGKKPGRFAIMALANNSEGYQYAQDWREVFISARWEIEHKDIPIQIFLIGGGMWSGIQFGVHDASPTVGQMTLENDSPEENLTRCLVGRADIPNGARIVPYKDKPTGSVVIQVSDQPQSE